MSDRIFLLRDFPLFKDLNWKMISVIEKYIDQVFLEKEKKFIEKEIPKAQSEIEENTSIKLEASSSVVWIALLEKIKQKEISEESKTVLLFTGGLFDSRPNEPHF